MSVIVEQASCDVLTERVAMLEARIQAAGEVMRSAPVPAAYPAPNGCYAPQAAMPSAYAAPHVYQQRGVPLGYVTIDRRTDFGGQYASIERRGLLGQTRFAARSSPIGTQIERRCILGQRLMLSTSACGPYGCP